MIIVYNCVLYIYYIIELIIYIYIYMYISDTGLLSTNPRGASEPDVTWKET